MRYTLIPFRIFIIYRCVHRSVQIAGGTATKLPCSSVLNGQVLRIQLNYTEYLTLCEVKVFTLDEGECSLMQ